jgi:hypothetical protein
VGETNRKPKCSPKNKSILGLSILENFADALLKRQGASTSERNFNLWIYTFRGGARNACMIIASTSASAAWDKFYLQCAGHGYVINVYTGLIFSIWTGSTALRFTAAGAPLAARRIRILPMNQHV